MLFVDAVAWIGLLSVGDQYWEISTRHFIQARRNRTKLITSSAVLFEILDGVSERDRRLSIELNSALQKFEVEVVHVDEMLFQSAWEFFDSRPDKGWSLTDCVSFVVMQQRGIHEALTYDHHFEQAGFRALMRSDRN